MSHRFLPTLLPTFLPTDYSLFLIYFSRPWTTLTKLCLPCIEFADDTAIYMQGDVENLKKLESGLSLLCKRSNAIINWHNSYAISLSNESHPAWHPHPSFMFINQGASTKYLGFQIGFNILSEITIVIHSIWQKLMYWSSKKLSLSGHIIVANQVFIPTSWYNLSC